MPALSDQAQTRLALASLFAALVKTLGTQDADAPHRFVRAVERMYRDMEDIESQPIGAMETLRWAKELIEPN